MRRLMWITLWLMLETDDGGRWKIQVRWRGFDEAFDTWESLDNLLEDVPALVKAYAREVADKELLEAIPV